MRRKKLLVTTVIAVCTAVCCVTGLNSSDKDTPVSTETEKEVGVYSPNLSLLYNADEDDSSDEDSNGGTQDKELGSLPKRKFKTDKEKEKALDEVRAPVEQLVFNLEDGLGWIEVPNAGIDLPIVQASDNSYYLTHDVWGRYAYNGSVFLDCRNSSGFEDMVSVLYGHNVKNGTIFSNLDYFLNKDFFESSTDAWLITVDRVYWLEIFSVNKVSDTDSIFTIPGVTEESKERWFAEATEDVLYFRDIGVSKEDKFLMLVTCTDYTNERVVVIARVNEY